jgi:glycosyltransferase involved in cell wall biosynthesis
MKIHLFNPLESLSGGSEWRTIELFRFLRIHADVTIWSRLGPNASFPDDIVAHTQTLSDDHFPMMGNFIFVGCYQHIGDWIYKSRSNRTIIIYNTDTPKKLAFAALRLPVLGPRLEIVFASDYMKKSIGNFDGPVHPSLIDLSRFTPSQSSNDFFTVGRLSRDVPEKHFQNDRLLYDALVENNIRVEIMGGLLLSKQVNKNVHLHAAGKYPADLFMRNLNCFYYRTDQNYIEPFGRVILEAMATGLVVVAHYKGGYKDYIRHGVDGFLFQNQQDAFKIILKLKSDPDMRIKIGKNARKKVEELFSKKNLEDMRNFYLA